MNLYVLLLISIPLKGTLKSYFVIKQFSLLHYFKYFYVFSKLNSIVISSLKEVG